MTKFISVDLETSGLDPEQHQIIEIGLCGLLDNEPLEISLPLQWDASGADPKALEINKALERDFGPLVDKGWCREYLFETLNEGFLIAKNPAFDSAFLKKFIGARPWHHRMIDITSLVMGWHFGSAEELGDPGDDFHPPSTEECEMIVSVKNRGHHTALGDAKWNWEVFQMITGVGL